MNKKELSQIISECQSEIIHENSNVIRENYLKSIDINSNKDKLTMQDADRAVYQAAIKSSINLTTEIVFKILIKSGVINLEE